MQRAVKNDVGAGLAPARRKNNIQRVIKRQLVRSTAGGDKPRPYIVICISS
ncbi:hypothetical protein [Hymenobacter lapidiphilus]|uniref:hypothetical protein n=1 Tax=Hymenobacter sp. CCM 8763 TaxID=2303334 RepID=UPI00167CC056|nr:hypothetical protein [Hymenobacter sp. CCM 8763]